MSRAILIACAPWAAWLAAGFVVLWLLARLCGARLQLSRLRALHACQHGGTQTLSFVLTLPVFIMVVLFIIQVSQLMIGVTVVHYAAFAAARCGTVWFPTVIEGGKISFPENGAGRPLQFNGRKYDVNAGPHLGVATIDKERQVWLAAMFACLPISPSRTLYTHNAYPPDDQLVEQLELLQREYVTQVPSAASNGKIPIRLRNKLWYANRATEVWITGLDIDSQDGPTYSPWDYTRDPTRDGGEIGWEDPLTYRVNYKLLLLPGAGKLLIKKLYDSNGNPDRVTQLVEGGILQRGGPFGDEIAETETIKLTAAVTMTNEGLKSVMPYVEYTTW